MEAAEKFGSMKDRVEGLLSTREDAYLGLLDVPHQGVSLTLHTRMHHWVHKSGLNAYSRRSWSSRDTVKLSLRWCGHVKACRASSLQGYGAGSMLACKQLLWCTTCTTRSLSQAKLGVAQAEGYSCRESQQGFSSCK